MSTDLTVGVASENSGVIENEDAKLIGSIVTKMLNGTYTREEIRRFDNRQNPFVCGRLSRKEREAWERFYGEELGLAVDVSRVTVPDNPGGFDRVIVVTQDVTIKMVLDACRRYFPVWTYTEDLDAVVAENERTTTGGSYAIRVRDRVEADEELKGRSAALVAQQLLATMTLLERLIYELKYFKETKKHLDMSNVTLATGSRDRGGSVPGVRWGDDGLGVGWCLVQSANDNRRARQVVS